MAGIPAPFALAFGDGWLGWALVKLNAFLIRLCRGLFAYQIFLVGSPLPTVDALLDDAVTGSARRAGALRHVQSAATRPDAR